MSLAGKAVHGAIWTIGSTIGSRVVTLVGTLLVTRYLAPQTLGEVGVALVLVATANQASSLGFGQYVVNKPRAGRRVGFHATVYYLLFGALALAAVALLREPLTPLFGAAGAARFVPGLVAVMLIDRVAYMPERVLARELRFRMIAVTRAISEVVYATTAVTLAALDFGGQAIVIANVVQSSFRLVVFLTVTERREWLEPVPLDRAVTADLFRYGVPISIGVFAQFASSRWDNLLFSRFFGTGALGLYLYAYSLASIPAVVVGEQISDVLNPSFAHMDEEGRKRALVRATAQLGLIIFPLAIGLAAVAHPLVAAAFNERWQGIAPLLVVLSVMSVVRPISFTVMSYLLTFDRPRLVMVLEVGKVCALLALVAALARFGTEWACVGVGLAFTLVAVVDVLVLRWLDGIPVGHFVRAFVGPLAACAPMAAAAIGVRYAAAALGVTSPLAHVIAGIAVGALVYVPSAFLFAGETAREFVRLVGKALRRGA